MVTPSVTYTQLTFATPEQIEKIITLYKNQGWWTKPLDGADMVARIVKGSHFFMTATVGDDIIGMGRAISDAVSDAYIQDVTVIEAYRGHGIGSTIIRKLLTALQNDGLEWIGLIAENNSRSFYEKLGFAAMEGSVPMLKKAPWNSKS